MMNSGRTNVSPRVRGAKVAICHPVVDFLLVGGASIIVAANNWSLHLLFGVELLLISVNIHHYFIDSDIWKSNNLEMRQTLFAHLEER